MTDEMAGETILRSVEVAARQAFCWTLLDKPREGSIFLLFFAQAGQEGGNAQNGTQTVLEDGLLYLQTVERVRTTTILKEGYELEVKEKTGGYLPGETMTSRERRLFRLKNLPKSGGREQLAAIIEGLTLVHYAPIPDHLRGPAPLTGPRRSYPLPPLPPMLVYLFGPPPQQPPQGHGPVPPSHQQQSMPMHQAHPPPQGTPAPQGPPMDRINNLSGRGQIKSASGSPSMAPNTIRQPVGGRPGRPGPKQFMPGRISPSGHDSPAPIDQSGLPPSQQHHGPPPAMFPLPPPQDLYMTGDEFDRISTKDISLARYKRRHDLMALLLSPYGIDDFEVPAKPDYSWACARTGDPNRSVEDKMKARLVELQNEIDTLQRV